MTRSDDDEHPVAPIGTAMSRLAAEDPDAPALHA